MARLISCGLLFGLILLSPTIVVAQKKDAKKDGATTKGTEEEYTKLNKAPEVVGKLVLASSGTLTFSVDYNHYEADKNPKKTTTPVHQPVHNNTAQLQQQLARAKTPAQRAQIQQQIQQHMVQEQARLAQQQAKNQAGQKLVTDHKEFDLEVSDKVIVRRESLPTEYDDKGSIKEYSKEEKAKFKGKDSTKPGYEAKYEDLKPGQKIKLFLTAGKAEKKTETTEDGAKKTTTIPAKPTVKMILIQEDISDIAAGPDAKDNKKKKKN